MKTAKDLRLMLRIKERGLEKLRKRAFAKFKAVDDARTDEREIALAELLLEIGEAQAFIEALEWVLEA